MHFDGALQLFKLWQGTPSNFGWIQIGSKIKRRPLPRSWSLNHSLLVQLGSNLWSTHDQRLLLCGELTGAGLHHRTRFKGRTVTNYTSTTVSTIYFQVMINQWQRSEKCTKSSFCANTGGFVMWCLANDSWKQIACFLFSKQITIELVRYVVCVPQWHTSRI